MRQATDEAERAANLRALLARHRIRIYALAPLVHVHPGRLGMALNGRAPLSAELAEKIANVVDSITQDAASAK